MNTASPEANSEYGFCPFLPPYLSRELNMHEWPKSRPLTKGHVYKFYDHTSIIDWPGMFLTVRYLAACP